MAVDFFNLSSPDGCSVNDSIDGSLTSLTHIKVEDIIEQVISLGKGSLTAKIDIESAFRIVPVQQIIAGTTSSLSTVPCHLALDQPLRYLTQLPMHLNGLLGKTHLSLS